MRKKNTQSELNIIVLFNFLNSYIYWVRIVIKFLLYSHVTGMSELYWINAESMLNTL